MKIKRLELVGFKSFVEPTVIEFDTSIVGVVGPNGCGKSNVVDAIRWVMGEMSPKSLRGRAMEDVIFNGSEKRPPFGMAEVSLTFSTDDGIAPADYAGFSEIMVTRRLFRSGDSEYLINKVPSRLRDVIDLFLGTGVGHKAYSIIEQGKIDFAISAKPEDRRLLIEEAAGISKFKSRKESALRKMEGTGQNLLRLKDILQEVTRQINSLDRQVKKAEKYKVLKNEVRELELKLSGSSYLEMTRELTELKSLSEDWNVKEAGSSAGLATIDNELERGRIELLEKDRQFNSLQERYFEVQSRLQLLEAQGGFHQKEIGGLEESKQQALREIEEMKERLTSLKLEKDSYVQKQLQLELHTKDSLHLVEKTLEDVKQKESVRDSLLKRVEQLKEEWYHEGSEKTRLQGEERLYEERIIAFKGQMASHEVEKMEVEKLHAHQKLNLEQKIHLLAEVSQLSQGFKTEIENLKTEQISQQERRDVLSQELELKQESLVLKNSRLKSLLELEKNFEGYDDGVRSILKAKKDEGRQDNGIFGVVAELIDTSPRYELAVSAALGEKLQYVVVKSQEEGVEAINYLKVQSAGRSTFIPMEIRETATEDFTYQQEGVVGPLLEHIQIKEGYQKIAHYLLGDVVLVNSLQDALVLWKGNGHNKTLVTLEGEVVDPVGVVSGGTAGIRGKILLEKKREIKELYADIAILEEEVGLKEDAFSQIECRLSELALSLETASRRSHEEELKRMSLEKEGQHLREEFQRVEGELIKFHQELSRLNGELEKNEKILGDCRARRTSFEETLSGKEQIIAGLGKQLDEAQVEVRASQEKLSTLRVQSAADSERNSMTNREVSRLEKSETELHGRIDQRLADISEAHQKMNFLQKSLDEGSQEISGLKKIAAELAVTQDSARKDYEVLASALQEKEGRVRELRKECDLAKQHTGDLRVTLSRLESDLGYLTQQIVEKYSVNLTEVATTYAGLVLDRPAEEETFNSLKEKLEQIGDVNLGSIPEYEELKMRQGFLTQQISDLETSLDALKKAIHRINQTTRTRFEETFEMVNERFKTLFPRLFHGGRAEIRLTTPEDGKSHDILNAGVEMLVQPPGKKLSHVGLLSGGEKAMAAVAFVFSIFLVKPSPFCILDEVDAPLDDTNTERFHKLIAEMVPRTQFILITHNRGTMEKADRLYGITMQEPGVSKLVTVKLSDGLKMAS